jgi:hypothetical protein
VSRRKRWVWLGLTAALVVGACGADGGSRGTGISALVAGNVTAVQNANPSIAGITVTLAPGGGSATTSSSGTFNLRGPFYGRITVNFTRPSDAVSANTSVNLPAGGTLTLNNIQIDNAQGTATAESEDVSFNSKIVAVDCPGQTLTLLSNPNPPDDTDTYTLRLDTSTVRDQEGNTLSCNQLSTGESAQVQGMVNPDGTFGQALVTIE